MRMRHVDIQRLLLPTLDHTLFFFFFGIQQNVTRPDPRNIYSWPKQSVVVCKYKECIMASCAKGLDIRELIGDELYKDYFDETKSTKSYI